MVSRSSALAAAIIATLSRPAAADSSATAPRVPVITMFGRKAKPWLDGEALTRKLAVPGLAKGYPEVACSDDGLWIMTTGMGYANAASSIAALVFSGRFDLTKTYFLISGIAGVDPAMGTLGSAALRRRWRLTERDRRARGAGRLERRLSGDRRLGAGQESRPPLRRRSLPPQRRPAAGSLPA